jgi:hypothetical protein
MASGFFMAYALGAAVLFSFLLCLLAFIPNWGRRNMAGYGRSPVHTRKSRLRA